MRNGDTITREELDRRMARAPAMTPEEHAEAAAAASLVWGFQIDVVSSGVAAPQTGRGTRPSLSKERGVAGPRRR